MGAMKVWNFSVTLCCARPQRCGAPRAAAVPADKVLFRKERRFIGLVSRMGICRR